MTKFTPHKPIAKCSDAELLALLDETSGEFRKLVLMEMGKRVAEEHRTGVRSNPSKSRTTAKYPYVYGIRPLGTGWQGYARLGLKSAEITSARQPSREDAADWLTLLLREHGVNRIVWEYNEEVKMTQHGWETELRKGLGLIDRADRQGARRNPSARASRATSKAYWWLIITRDDATAIGHRYESREDMMKYSKRHAANLRGDNSKALIRGTEPMTTAAFRKAFKTAYPKFTLEV